MSIGQARQSHDTKGSRGNKGIQMTVTYINRTDDGNRQKKNSIENLRTKYSKTIKKIIIK